MPMEEKYRNPGGYGFVKGDIWEGDFNEPLNIAEDPYGKHTWNRESWDEKVRGVLSKELP